MAGTYSQLLTPKQAPEAAKSPPTEDTTVVSPSDAYPTAQSVEAQHSVIYAQSAEPVSSTRTENRSEFRAENRSIPFPFKRRTKRYSFEFYEDQIFAVKKLVYEANMADENICQSDIVRQALDNFLEKQK